MRERGWLLITRLPGQKILIGPDGPDQVVISVNAVRGKHVSIAVKAPGQAVVRPGKEQDHRDLVEARLAGKDSANSG